MSDSKLRSLKDLLWGLFIFACILAMVIAFFICAVTRNEFDREDRGFAFSNSKPASSTVQANANGLDAMSSDGNSGAANVESFEADGNASDNENEGQYFNAAEYWSSIANGSDDGAESSGSIDGLDA